LGEFLRSEEVCGDCGAFEVWQFSGSSQWVWRRLSEVFSFVAKRWQGIAMGCCDYCGLIKA
jgi:hypothetical protein